MKKFLSLVLALVMTMSLVTVSAGAKDFTDDDKITYEEAVAVISEIGVVDGYADGKFNPTNTLTRQAAAKIICNLILGPTTAAELHADTAPYKDVPATSEFAGYIAYCAKEGIISGYADGTFKPGNTLTGYAFMKMLLGALGYDAEVEGYTGGNWSINVAKQAINVGLNKGLEGDFNGIKAVTREEACLYAFNTLQADMVEYDAKTNVTVGGAEVVIAGSDAKALTWKNSATRKTNIKDDDYVQFAEQYFTKLEKVADTDDFMRPAHTWTVDKKEIGTYVDSDKLVASYTTAITGREVYDLLKASVIRDNDLEVYVDGSEADGKKEVIEKTDLVRSNENDLGATGKGVLTEIYLDTDKDLLTFVSINTYLAQATADYSEKKETVTLKVFETNATGTSKTVDVADVPEIVDIEKDDFVLVQMSDKTTKNLEVVSVSDVEIMEDSTVTKFTKGTAPKAIDKLTTGGTQYDAAAKAFYDEETLDEYDESLLTDITYNVYLDQYGYVIGVDVFEGTKNYVFITGYDRNSSNISVKTADAAAIFPDGTMDVITVNVTDTNKNIKALNDTTPAGTQTFFKEWTSGNTDGNPVLNRWYTYTKSESGVYTLKPAVRSISTAVSADTTIDCTNVRLAGRGAVQNASKQYVNSSNVRVYGEDASIFITVDQDKVDTTHGQPAITDVTGVYTGVQDVDLIIDASAVNASDGSQNKWAIHTVYDSDNYIIASIVVGEAQGSVANYAYVLSESAKSEEKIGDTYYWEVEVVTGGEVKTVTVKSKYTSVLTGIVAQHDKVVELRYDGDYVVGYDAVMTNKPAKVYDNADFTTKAIKDESIYFVTLPAIVSGTNYTGELYLQGRTLYVTPGQDDYALTLIRDAKAVVIQKENDKKVKTEFASVAEAIDRLADADQGKDGLQYEGKIVAILNSDGVADWVLFVNDKGLETGSGKPTTNNDGIKAIELVKENGKLVVKYTDETATAAVGNTVTATFYEIVNGKSYVVSSKTENVAVGADHTVTGEDVPETGDYYVVVTVKDSAGKTVATATSDAVSLAVSK